MFKRSDKSLGGFMLKYEVIGYSLILLSLGMVSSLGCAPFYKTVKGQSCSASQDASGGVTILCEDGTSTYVYPGAAGSNGINGTNGSNGQDGAAGATGSQGVAGQNGTNGVNGQNGSNGVDGQNGSNGQDGAPGANGIDATPVTIVPLCPGVSNHAVFVEIGICLGGKLYGVYSANGGFMTYLADGAYSSNAIGSACNLVITGCVVSH